MKMPDKIEPAMIAPCGLNCLACSAHLAEKTSCPGCQAPEEKITRMSCRNCVKKKCAFEKGLQWCFQCNDFPCIQIKNIARRYQKNYNVDLIHNGWNAKKDLNAFLQEQQERFTCKSCGGIIDQHHHRCSECGTEQNISKSTNKYTAIYKAQLAKGDIQIAYESLLKYLMALKSHMANALSNQYRFGNVSPGYLDYSYFPFFNEFSRDRQLRFGIVLNHRQMCFELWLMGQNAAIQKKYWNLLKTKKWNNRRDAMPQYSVLEAVLVRTPDFDNLDALSVSIEQAAMAIVEEVIAYLGNIH